MWNSDKFYHKRYPSIVAGRIMQFYRSISETDQRSFIYIAFKNSV